MRAHTTALFLAGLTFGLAGAVSAQAESGSTPPPAGQLEQREQRNARPGPAAPAGHRQPQAKDAAPAEMPPADQATRDLDKALAKKLTICRGC
jgi:hypothetical protein